MTLTRRTALLAPLLSAPLLMLARLARAQDYPPGTLRIIAPGPAGSPRDLRARWVAEQLGAALERSVIVDNKPGAGGNIGMEAAARSAPDGRTLVIVDNGTMAQNPHIYQRPGYDALADFSPVIILIEAPLLLAVPTASPVRSVSDLVALAKASPGKLSYGTPGVATPPHLAIELFNRAAGIDVVHVPYKGAPPAMQDLAAGRLDYMIDNVGLLQALAAAGKVRAIAVSSPVRLDSLPDLPTFAEQGLADATYVAWMGVAVPAGTPVPLIERLNVTLARALATDKAKAWFRDQGASVLGGSVADFTRRVELDFKRWGEVIRHAGIKPE
ncbi:MAG TPA: tripartite tricarboxylate transporter substrate binding protein [Afipia sp.]